MYPEEFRKQLLAEDVTLTDQQMAQFDTYFHLLVKNESHRHYGGKRGLFEAFLRFSFGRVENGLKSSSCDL